MERLTEKHYLGTDHYMKCSGNCNVDMDCIDCPSFDCLVERLAAYEDTGLTPERCAEFARADAEGRYIVMRDAEQEGVARLRELAEADRDGRLVVLPCQSGEHVFTLLDGQKRVRECEVKYAVLDGWLKVFYIEPIGAPGNLYSVPFGAFGQTVFLTREEAEKALEELE